MSKSKFYGLAGVNGYGVYTDYAKVIESGPYLKKFVNKKFSCFEDAKRWAMDRYEEYQSYGTRMNYRIDDIKETDWIYYRKKIKFC